MQYDDTQNDPSASGPSYGTEPQHLSAADAAMLDRLVEADFDLAKLASETGGLTPVDAARARRLLAQFALLDAYPTFEVTAMTEDDSETLIAATMARIARADDERSARMRLDAQPNNAGRMRRGMRWSDLIAVACIAILVTTIVVPILHWSRARSLEMNCANNLRLVAMGLESYAKDFNAMPMRDSLVPDIASWTGYRNADNLRVLSSSHYCTAECMCCPGDSDPNGTFAFQAPATSRHPLWNQSGRSWESRVASVGDRNPLVDLERNGAPVATVALNSASHGGEGQNLLFTDGSIEFRTSPYLAEKLSNGHHDNIWLPFGDQADALLRRAGTDVDVFLLQ